MTRVTAAGLVDLGGADIKLAEVLTKQILGAIEAARTAGLDLTDPDMLRVVAEDARNETYSEVSRSHTLGDLDGAPLSKPAADKLYRAMHLVLDPHSDAPSEFSWDGKSGAVRIGIGPFVRALVRSPMGGFEHKEIEARLASVIAHELRHAADQAYRHAAGEVFDPDAGTMTPALYEQGLDAPAADLARYVNDPTELKSWAGQLAAELRIAFGNDATKLRNPRVWPAFARSIWKHVAPENRHDFLSRLFQEFLALGDRVARVARLVQRSHDGQQEWALVSKDGTKVLEWFGARKPSDETVAHAEQRVEYFKHKGKIPYSMMDERRERERYEEEARARDEAERKNKERRLMRTRVPVVPGAPILPGQPAPAVTRVAAPEEWQLTPENENYPSTQQVLPEPKRDAPKTPEQLGIAPDAGLVGVPVQAVQAVTWYVWKYTGRKSASLIRVGGPERVQVLKQKYPERAAEIDQLAAADPSAPRYAYLEWMLRQQGTTPVALGSLLQRFDAAKARLSQRDINRYTPTALEEALIADTAAQEESTRAESNARLVYSDGGWLMYEIGDYPTMCALGEGRWCVGYTHTKKYWNSYMGQPGGHLYKIDGPTEDAPYLLYTRDDQAREIKDRQNNDVSADDPVHNFVSEALGIESGAVAEEPWVYQNIEDILDAGFRDWFGWGHQYVINDAFAYAIDGASMEETIDHIRDWVAADWEEDGQSAAEWQRNSDSRNFRTVVRAWWEDSGQFLNLPDAVEHDETARRYALWLLDIKERLNRHDDLTTLFEAADWSKLAATRLPGDAPAPGVTGDLATMLTEHETAIPDDQAIWHVIRWAANGVTPERLQQALSDTTDPNALTVDAIDAALGLSRAAARSAACTLSRRGYQRYEGCLPDGRKVQVGAAERVAHGTYPAGQRQRRERAWFVRVNGEDIGYAATFNGARAILEKYAAT